MKALLGIVGGFIAALGLFAIGVVAATAVFTTEPENRPPTNQADLWTAGPQRVDRAKQDFERLPALQAIADAPADLNLFADMRSTPAVSATADFAAGAVDTLMTGSVERSAEEELVQSRQLEQANAAHEARCASRYRSYRAADDSYQPYGGGPRRQCR